MLRSRRRAGSRPAAARRLRGAAGAKPLRGARAPRERSRRAGGPPRARLVLLGPARPGLEAAVWDERGDPERDSDGHCYGRLFLGAAAAAAAAKSPIPTVNRVMKLGDPKIARRLLLSGADPNLKDSTGFAVIHDVAREGFADTLQALLEFQADVNLEDAEGNLPLHLAAQEGHAPVVEALLARADCKVGHRNKRGATAYDLAKLYKRSAVVKLLEDSRCCPAPMD
uniref:Cyclin dependent kinase inhibitor 2C n=1 Tax=Accipiter nisus TaxID=211598 RepID=A0A8B9RVZ0_9AVES